MANVTFDSEVAFHSSRVICQDTPAVESPKSSLCTRIQRLPFAHLTQALIATAVSLGVVSISSGTQTAVGLPQPDSFSVYKASGASPGQDVQPFATQSDPVGFESGGGGRYVAAMASPWISFIWRFPYVRLTSPYPTLARES